MKLFMVLHFSICFGALWRSLPPFLRSPHVRRTIWVRLRDLINMRLPLWTLGAPPVVREAPGRMLPVGGIFHPRIVTRAELSLSILLLPPFPPNIHVEPVLDSTCSSPST
jgi:hypothetical protein